MWFFIHKMSNVFVFSNGGKISLLLRSKLKTRVSHNFPKRKEKERKSISSLNYYDFNKAPACLLLRLLFFPSRLTLGDINYAAEICQPDYCWFSAVVGGVRK